VASGLVASALGVSPVAASSPARLTNRHSVKSGPHCSGWLLGLAYTQFVYAIVVLEVYTPLSLQSVKMSNITEAFGVRIDASNSFVQAAIYGFLVVGIAAFAAPIVSTIRVLLSLFVLPGKSVCDSINQISQSLTDLSTSSAPLVPAAPGLLSQVLLMALARSSRSPSQPRATISSSFPAPNPSSTRSPPTFPRNMALRSPPRRSPWTLRRTRTPTTPA
jgi:hypothetical protein